MQNGVFAQSSVPSDLEASLQNVDYLTARLSYLAEQGFQNGRLNSTEYQELNLCETQLSQETQTILSACHQSGYGDLIAAAQEFDLASTETLGSIDALQSSYETQGTARIAGSDLSATVTALSAAAGGIRKEVQISSGSK